MNITRRNFLGYLGLSFSGGVLVSNKKSLNTVNKPKKPLENIQQLPSVNNSTPADRSNGWYVQGFLHRENGPVIVVPEGHSNGWYA